MFLANTLPENLALGDAAVIALLGYAVVFFGLVLLMLVVIIFGKIFAPKPQKKAAPAAAPAAQAAAPAAAPVAAPAAVPVAVSVNDPAPGSAGRIKLHDVPPKTAAMLMAIVANQLGKPLNELRFISIKEVK